VQVEQKQQMEVLRLSDLLHQLVVAVAVYEMALLDNQEVQAEEQALNQHRLVHLEQETLHL
jgi:hypothetical protein